MVAMRAGMNVVAFDKDPAMTSSTGMRLNNFENKPDPSEETRAKKPSEENVEDDAGDPPPGLQDETGEG